MQEIIENYKSLWLRSIEERKAIARVGSQAKFMMLNRTRLMEESATEIEEFLWNEFKVCKENLYYLHLRIAEYCLTTWFDDVNEKEASVLFLNRTFDNWTRNYASIVQKEQLKKMKTNEATADSAAAAANQPNLLALETYHILKAFDLAVKNINLFSSFNRIYKFDQNFNVLRVKMDELVQKIDGLNLFKIISELKVNDVYHIDYEPIVVPLMISDKYKQIEELINSNENTLISIVELCDKLCAANTNFKKIAEKYDCKKSNRFGGSQVSKFALNLLKRSKKAHLVYSTYLGIQFQLRLNQLRFLVYQAYNPADPMSFEGWSELAIDLIGNDERLIGQLFSEIVQYNKDINMGIFFAEKYGYDYIRRLPSQTQDFFDKNLPMLKSIYMENIELKWTPSKLSEFYFPDDLKDENIVFVDDEKKFVDMLDYFEAKKPDIIGLDCEWKPTFGPDDSEMTPEVMAQAAASPNWNGDKNQRANTLQIATRERSFVVEVRDLVDSLSKEHLDRFGQLVLFDDNILKLGYGFDQDAQRLNHSFWKFQHRLCEFTQSVVNMDEIATDVQRRYNLFGDDPGEKPFITKPSESDLAKIASTSSMASAATAAEPTPNNNGNNKNQKQPSGTPKPKGLSKLTFLCFGKPLDKRECMSNWANRPLRHAQLRYAALDAFVLIKINDLFVEKFKALNIEFDYLLGGRKSFF